MGIYKATFQMNASGLLSSREYTLTELYTADSITEAKSQADNEVKRQQNQMDKNYIPLWTMRVIVTLADIEKVE
jgi:hypothetical protein